MEKGGAGGRKDITLQTCTCHQMNKKTPWFSLLIDLNGFETTYLIALPNFKEASCVEPSVE